MPTGIYIRKKGKCTNTGRTHFKKGHPGFWKGKKKLPYSEEWRENIGKGQHKGRKPKYTHIGGYILIYKPKHPFATQNGYVFEHRLVMEKHLGRYRTPEEIVHHKGIKYPIGSI